MKRDIHSFLLIGQSNMAGRGNLDDVPAIQNPDILMFRDGKWIQAVEPLHTDKPDIAGIGLGMSFAVEMLKVFPGSRIGLIPCAFGGTSLNEWAPGAHLYQNAVSVTKLALADSVLKGILWHQGEGDSQSMTDALTYSDRLCSMLTTIIAELHGDNVAVITGELGEFLKDVGRFPHFKIVNETLHGLRKKIPRYACASSSGLTDNGDKLHFGAASLRKLGWRYAREFLKVQSGKPVVRA